MDADGGLWTVDCKLWVLACGLWVVGCGLCVDVDVACWDAGGLGWRVTDLLNPIAPLEQACEDGWALGVVAMRVSSPRWRRRKKRKGVEEGKTERAGEGGGFVRGGPASLAWPGLAGI